MRAIILIFSLEIYFSQALAGGFISNGGDYLKTQNNPWFLGPEKISYCIDASQDYQLNKNELEQLVNESISDWKSFFAKYKLNEEMLGSSFYKELFFDKAPRKISQDFELVSTCQNISLNHILFLFGKTNSEIDRAVEQRASLSVGISLRRDYSHQTFKNSGYIWVKKFSNDRNKIKHILLHELGHVFGLKHNSVFVMDERVADQMENLPVSAKKSLGQIEIPTWSYDFIKVPQTIHFTWNQGGQDNIPLGFAPNKNLPREVRSVIGLNEEGFHSLTLKHLRSPVDVKFSYFEFNIEKLGEKEGKKIILTLNANNDISSADYNVGLYTKWYNQSGKDLGYFEQFFDMNPTPRSFLGIATIDLKNTAATLSINKGTILRIYLPELSTWWEVK